MIKICLLGCEIHFLKHKIEKIRRNIWISSYPKIYMNEYHNLSVSKKWYKQYLNIQIFKYIRHTLIQSAFEIVYLVSRTTLNFLEFFLVKTPHKLLSFTFPVNFFSSYQRKKYSVSCTLLIRDKYQLCGTAN